MKEEKTEIIEIKNILKDIKNLFKYSLAIQLYSNGKTQDEICKGLQLSKSTVNKMVKGIKKKKKIDE